jgi:hypothetical protein
MNRRLAIFAPLLCAFALNAAAFTVTNEIDGGFNASSYDTDWMCMSHPFATFFYNGYPQYTNHIYSWSRSGSGWDGDYQQQEGKWLLPLFNSFPVPGYNWILANDNGGLTSNTTATAGLEIASLPPTNYNFLASAPTNEGVPMPAITTQPLGRAPHDSIDGDSGAINGNAGSMGLAAALGVPVIDMWHLMWTPAFQADQAGARLMWSGIGGSHFTQAGYLAMDIFALQKLGVETNVGSITINFNAGTVAATDHAGGFAFSKTGQTVTGTFFFSRMPMSWDVPGTYGSITITNDARAAFTVFPSLGSAFNWTFQVTNLPAGNYTISVDGTQVDAATDTQLAAGRNWFTNYNGPFWAQRTAVLLWKRYQAGVDPVTLVSHGVGVSEGIPGAFDLRDYQSGAGNTTEVYPGAFTGTNYITHMATYVSQLHQYDVAIHNASIQTNHTLTITQIQPPPPVHWRLHLR